MEPLDLERLARCLAGLAERERTIVALSFYAERDADAIATELGLNPGNVRVVRHDAVEVLRDMVPRGSLAGIHVFFPDPWPKKRHHKRRLVQPEFARLAAERLAPGGYIHVATDWEEYAAHVLQVLTLEKLLANTAENYAPRPATRPETKFERRGLKLGHGVWDIVFTRVKA